MPNDLSPRRILAVKLADLGDLLTVTPALQALREAHPHARLDLLTPPTSARLLQGAPYLDNIITFDKFPFDRRRALLDARQVIASLRFFRELRLARYDALAIFHHFTTRWGTLKFALLCMASGARARAGLDNGRGRFLTLRAEDRGFGALHEVDYWLEVAALLGADPSAGWRPYLPVGEPDRLAALHLTDETRARHNGPLVAIHTGAGAYGPARVWPLERFAALARGLVEEGAAIIVVGGPDEVSMASRLEALVGAGGDKLLNLAGHTSIGETAAVIEVCDLFVGNDSGPMHIAAAMRTPVVAIFGPSNAQAWGPYTPRGERNANAIVSLDLPCQPCFYRAHTLGLREGCGPRPCLTHLGHEQALAACRRALTRVQGSRFKVQDETIG